MAMPTPAANPAEEARNRRDRAAYARELARNITDKQTIDNLHTLASDLEHQASELEAQAAAPPNALDTAATGDPSAAINTAATAAPPAARPTAQASDETTAQAAPVEAPNGSEQGA
jgi:hypothetical protein